MLVTATGVTLRLVTRVLGLGQVAQHGQPSYPNLTKILRLSYDRPLNSRSLQRWGSAAIAMYAGNPLELASPSVRHLRKEHAP